MAPSKLTEADKRAIIDLYRQPGETTITIGNRYGVSNSTISRILKSTLPAEEYEALMQQKRVSGGGQSTEVSDSVAPSVATPDTTAENPGNDQSDDSEGNTNRRVRRRSSASADDLADNNAPDKPKVKLKSAKSTPSTDKLLTPLSATDLAPASATALTDDDLLDGDKELDGLDEDDDDLDDDDLDDLDGDLDDDDDLDDLDDDDLGFQLTANWNNRTELQILPLSEASLPRPCYLVVDRAAELVTRPLKDFGNLGQLSEQEIQQQTLPVFDNHRIARRFSRRNQRVIKVPDGQILQKTTTYLQAKGITRLFVDGQVYSLQD